MAQRRMFSKTITSSSQFLMMPQSSQNLYFHLGMNADDDGFCEHFTIMRMTESKPDDLKVLQSKNFIKVFDEKILIIIDWKENNYLRSDRYTPSKYLDIYRKEVKKLSTDRLPSGIPEVDKVATQDRIGKDRIGKDTNTSNASSEEPIEIVPKKSETSSLAPEVIKLFEVVNPACKKMYGNTTQRKACDNLISEYGFEEVSKVIAILLQTNKLTYFPTITTPAQLWNDYSKLKSKLIQEKNKNTSKKKNYKVAF